MKDILVPIVVNLVTLVFCYVAYKDLQKKRSKKETQEYEAIWGMVCLMMVIFSVLIWVI